MDDRDSHLKDEFFPKGAIAFFVALILFFASTWLAIYALMVSRHLGV